MYILSWLDFTPITKYILDTKKTCLGPAYGDPINRLLVINTPKDNEKYLAYSTPKKVLMFFTRQTL